MSTSVITRKFPGKTDDEIYARVDEAMGGVAHRHHLDYRRDAAARTGSVAKMGAHGHFAVRGGEVKVELKYPMIVPHAIRRRIEEDLERHLDALFG